MKALILRDDTEAAAAYAAALFAKGFQVVCVETRHMARALLRLETVDLMVVDERIGGGLTHSVALAAERCNPYISIIMLTDRSGADTDDLYDLIPALYSMIGTATPPDLFAQIALSSIENFEQAETRVKRNAARFIIDEDAQEAAMWEDPSAPDDAAYDDIGMGDSIPRYAALLQAVPALADRTDPALVAQDDNPLMQDGVAFNPPAHRRVQIRMAESSPQAGIG